MDFLATDDLTVVLGLVSVSVFLLRSLYKPQPLVHPILLGRQSDVARVRNPGESAVYRNYGTGMMGRFPLRPAKEVHLVADLVKADQDASRTLWSTKITNADLNARVAAVGAGLIRVAGLVPRSSTVLILLNDGIEFLVSDLALAADSIKSMTLSSLDLLSPVLDNHIPSAIITHGELLPQILELIYDADGHEVYTVIVVGEERIDTSTKRHGSQVNIIHWADLENGGHQPVEVAPPISTDVYTVSFFAAENGELQGAQLTHENLTAGVAAVKALIPLSSAISPLDTIVSAHSMGTAFGRSIVYTALFEGTSFATLPSANFFIPSTQKDPAADFLATKTLPIPSPTILFIKPTHLHSLAGNILTQAKKSTLKYFFGWRHKHAAAAEGFLTQEGLWDRLVFDRARAEALGSESATTIRSIIVSGGALKEADVIPARIAFSVPVVNAQTHGLVAAPVFATHPFDLQSFSSESSDSFSTNAPVGPPSTNVEAKLVGVDDEGVEGGSDPVGVLLVRGPSVGTTLDVAEDRGASKDWWVGTGLQAKVHTNGSFKVL